MNMIDNEQIKALVQQSIEDFFIGLAIANELRTGDITPEQQHRLDLARDTIAEVTIQWIIQNGG